MKSLKTKVIFSVMLLFTLVFLGSSYMGILYFKVNAVRTVQAQQSELVFKLADEVNTKLKMLIRVLDTASETIQYEDFLSHETADDFLKEYKVLTSVFDDNVMVFDSAGRLLAETGDNNPARINMSFMWRSYITEPLSTKKLFISPPIMAAASDKLKMPMVVLAAPVIKEGKIIGIIAGSVNLYRKNIFDNTLFTSLNNNGWIYVTDKQGNIVMHPDTRKITGKMDEIENPFMHEMITLQEGSISYVDGTNREVQASFNNIPASGWIIVANYPSDNIFKPIYRAEANLIYFVIAGALLVFFILRFLTRSLINPLISLKEQVYRMMYNPETETRIVVSSNDEIKETANAFNNLLDEIYKSRNELKENKELFQTVCKFSEDWIYWIDKNGKLLYFSPAAGAITGYNDEELSDYPDFYEKIIHPDDYEKWLKLEQTARRNSGNLSSELRIYHKNGSIVWLKIDCAGIFENGSFIGIRGAYRDITDTVVMEKKLRGSEKKYQILIQNSDSPIILTDSAFMVTEYNEKAYYLLGCECQKSVSDYLGKTSKSFADTFDSDTMLEVFDIESDVISCGEVYHYLWHVNALNFEGYEKTGFMIVGADITSKVKTSEEIKRKALKTEIGKYTNHLEAVINNVSDSIISVDKNMRLVCFNSVAEATYGLKQEDIYKPVENINNFFANVLAGLISKTARSRKPVRDICSEVEREEGNMLLRLSLSPLTDGDGKFTGVLVVARDETVRCYVDAADDFPEMIGTGEKMQSVFALMRSLSTVDSTVLILGESGTGKELVAAGIHASGNRKDKPFIKLNCSAIPENLLESELFGHVKGSFTGAVADKQGKFEAANGGTIFLDEIGDISPNTQVRLLRVLQEKEIEVIGKNQPVKIDVRVIAATNRDLKDMVNKGEFREDLYYRLKVVSVSVPPLRERKEDIVPLISMFMHKFSKKLNKNIVDVTDDVRRVLENYMWCGNVRELEHVIEHACLMASTSFITVADLPAELNSGGLEDADAEREQIIKALTAAKGYKAKAARILGISRATLYRKLHEYRIEY
jgi:PAS domain S-box-containing protein